MPLIAPQPPLALAHLSLTTDPQYGGAMNQFHPLSHRTGRAKSRQYGFSLIELMVVITISGILVALAAPAFRNMIDVYRVNATTDSLTSALELTRSTAIQMNGGVAIAKIPGSACSTAAEWTCGWRVFLDADSDSTYDSGETIFQEFSALGGVTVMRNGTGGAGSSANRWGQINNIGASSFVIAPLSGVSSEATTTVCMNSGGRIRKVTGEVTC